MAKYGVTAQNQNAEMNSVDRQCVLGEQHPEAALADVLVLDVVERVVGHVLCGECAGLVLAAHAPEPARRLRHAEPTEEQGHGDECARTQDEVPAQVGVFT
jgi:hypothetical protein